MKTTIDFLNAVKTRHNIQRDADLARLLEITPPAIASYKKGHSSLSDENAYKVALLLGISPEYTMACANAERAQNEKVKFVWTRLAGRLNEDWKQAA